MPVGRRVAPGVGLDLGPRIAAVRRRLDPVSSMVSVAVPAGVPSSVAVTTIVSSPSASRSSRIVIVTLTDGSPAGSVTESGGVKSSFATRLAVPAYRKRPVGPSICDDVGFDVRAGELFFVDSGSETGKAIRFRRGDRRRGGTHGTGSMSGQQHRFAHPG